MKLIALGKDAKHVCLRYRIDPVRTALRDEGHWFSIQEMPSTPWGRLALYRELRHAHVVIVQRRLLSTWEVPILRRVSKHLIFDFDDALFQKSSYHEQSHSSRRLARFKAMMQAADQVFAGNDYLAEYANRFTHADKIVLMPTCVDVERYPLAVHNRQGTGVRLVWIGSSSTLRGLEQRADLWNSLGRALPGLELHLICDRFPHWPDIKLVPIPWSAATEVQHLAQCDIGLAWMPDDNWSQGKCGLKVLQCQAAGLPVVTNPIGVNRHLVVPEQNGYWANSTEDWIEAIKKLMHDAPLRRQMGRQGRQQVDAGYSNQQLIQRWKSALRLDSTASTTTSTDRIAAA
jgi:glycosyltransferase involved in cell wall biosynthesis